MSKKIKHTTRINTYSIEEIFNFLRNNPPPTSDSRLGHRKQYYIDTAGNKMSVRRARVFLEKGTSCKCGLIGSFFALERHRDGALHLDLYAKDKIGDDVLMTVDHKHPASKGGPDTMENYDTMCIVCNKEKGDKVLEA